MLLLAGVVDGIDLDAGVSFQGPTPGGNYTTGSAYTGINQVIFSGNTLSFDGKFVHQSYGILRRIGSDSTDAGRLAREFEEAVGRVRRIIRDLLTAAPPHDRETFERRFLALDPAALQELLTFCSDLRWYKNWTLDNRPDRTAPRTQRTPRPDGPTR